MNNQKQNFPESHIFKILFKQSIPKEDCLKSNPWSIIDRAKISSKLYRLKNSLNYRKKTTYLRWTKLLFPQIHNPLTFSQFFIHVNKESQLIKLESCFFSQTLPTRSEWKLHFKLTEFELIIVFCCCPKRDRSRDQSKAIHREITLN